MFYRQGGSASRINTQFDEVYADFIDGATGWMPVSNGNEIAINIARASITYVSSAASAVKRSALAPQTVVVLEMKTTGNGDSFPINSWQNVLVALKQVAARNGWVRLRIVNIDTASGGDGLSMSIQISRNVGA